MGTSLSYFNSFDTVKTLMFPKKTQSKGITIELDQPLYQRVPTRDEDGAVLSDCMMLFPGLRDLPRHLALEKVALMQAVLVQFSDVVFADLNVRLNLLWVSFRPKRGIILDIASAMHAAIPESVLVGQPPHE